jgi:hypothetical protein
MLCTKRALGPRAFNQRLKEMTDPLDVLRQYNDYAIFTTKSICERRGTDLAGLAADHSA